MTAAILLAAGESTRMGRPKALLPWGGITLIEHQVRELRAAGVVTVVVVLGDSADVLRSHVPAGAQIIVNKAYRQGRASSLRAGAAALPDNADPIVVLNVDEPRTRSVLQTLVEAHADEHALITRPTYHGKLGHPPVLAGSLLQELRAASDENLGLRGVVLAHTDEVLAVELDDETVLVGFNTPAEYQRALRVFGGAG